MKVNDANLAQYQKLVENKYLIYNSLFLNLPYDNIDKIGILIPVLAEACQRGYNEGMSTRQLMDDFFDRVELADENQRINFMFRVIQYVERQVVLFDAIEDVRFRSRPVHQLHPLQTMISNAPEREKKTLIQKLNKFGVRLVFTAHPTQFYPLWVLDIINDLRESIFVNDFDGANDLLIQLGMTSFLHKEKPSPFEEAKNIIYYLRNVYYDAVGDLIYDIDRLSEGQFDNFNLLKLGFWPGGDRDGNPFVDAETTMNVADELRMTLYKCYYHDIKNLKRKLSFRGVSEILEGLRSELYDAMFDSEKLLFWTEIADKINLCKEKLESDYHSFGLEELNRFEIKLKIFKSFFASLDIRQDHSIHKSLMEKIFKVYKLSDTPIDELSEEDMLIILESNNLELNPDDFDDPVHKDTINNIKQLGEIQRKNGNESCHRYIISNSEDIFSVLFVYSLFRWCGWKADAISFDIVPLFETMAGMSNSRDTMRKLFEYQAYKDHLQRRSSRQTIMLGFSDGTKDGGYMRANWSIYNTKSSLSKLCSQYDVEAIFFDGRGGPPARGGGKTSRFYASIGHDIANNEIQLTIQGQTITSTYGTSQQFVYNCEQLLCAGLGKVLLDGSAMTVMDSERWIFEKLSQYSFEKYDDLRNHPKFISYLEEMSTLKYYSKAKIGSRPSKRGKTEKLTLKDLRAISFVGSWSQLKQNVPGYFGLGTAVERLISEGQGEAIELLYKNNKYFKALVQNSMMSLKKSYFPLTSYMKDDETYGEFWNILKGEYELTKRLLLEITDYSTLMEDEIISKTSIELRERIVLPLLSIQQYALQRVADKGDKQELYEKLVMRSMYGNINASRNSA